MRHKTVALVKDLDAAACEANSVWQRLERTKEVLRDEAPPPVRREINALGLFWRGEDGNQPIITDKDHLERIRENCLATYGGGHRGNDRHYEIYVHGMETVFNVLRGGPPAEVAEIAEAEGATK